MPDSLLATITHRRSIRKYQSRSISSSQIDLLLEAARLAPSACNLQPFRALVAHQHHDLDVLRKAAYNLGAVRTAPIIILGMTDMGADQFLEERMVELIGSGAVEPVDTTSLISGKLEPFTLKLGIDVAIMSASIAMEHIVLQAQHMGLGSCWVHHFAHDEVREYFKIPLHYKLLSLLTIGYPDESPEARPRIADIAFHF
jgi:nitroreductase